MASPKELPGTSIAQLEVTAAHRNPTRAEILVSISSQLHKCGYTDSKSSHGLNLSESDELHPVVSEQVLDGVVPYHIQVILHELCNILPTQKADMSYTGYTS